MKKPGPLQGEELEKFMSNFKDIDERCVHQKGDRIIKIIEDNVGQDMHHLGDIGTVVSTLYSEHGTGYIVQFERDAPHVLTFIVGIKIEAYEGA